MTTNEILDLLEELDSSSEVYIEQPDVCELTDEDSGLEAKQRWIKSLYCNYKFIVRVKIVALLCNCLKIGSYMIKLYINL